MRTCPFFPGLAACLTSPNRPGQPRTLYGQAAAFKANFKTPLGPRDPAASQPHCPTPPLLPLGRRRLWTQRRPLHSDPPFLLDQAKQGVWSGLRLPGLNPSFLKKQIATNRHTGLLRDGICSCFISPRSGIQSLSLLASAPGPQLCPAPQAFRRCRLWWGVRGRQEPAGLSHKPGARPGRAVWDPPGFRLVWPGEAPLPDAALQPDPQCLHRDTNSVFLEKGVYFYISGNISSMVSADTEQSRWCLSGGPSVGSQ